MFMNFSKLSILIVEDVSPMRKLLGEIATTLDIGTVYTAANGNEGYKQYVLKQPDIIITDWHMPEIDGLELIEKIRKDPQSPKRTIPIIMISGLTSPDRVIKARDLGITEYLVKPFNVKDIAQRISHTINNPRDFILTADFVGPDRRRKESDNFKGESRRETDNEEKTGEKKQTSRIIAAKKDLQQKTGNGNVRPDLIKKSEIVIEKTKIDFIPMAIEFLKNFRNAINAAEKANAPCKKIKEELIISIMQLKANAHIFKYDLIGDLSNTTLDFLESIEEIDSLILEILNAQHKTLSHLVNTNMKGNGGKIGENLKKELQEAYKRYKHTKTLGIKSSLEISLNNTHTILHSKREQSFEESRAEYIINT